MQSPFRFQAEKPVTRLGYILGTPLLTDIFHQQRWDYVYYFKPGYGEPTEQRVTLLFNDDSLASITGTIHPEAGVIAAGEKRGPVTVVVPPFERVEPGLLNKIWHWITFRTAQES